MSDMSPNSPAKKAGVLIVFEGIDGTGKSTQSRRLADALRDRGHVCALLREPTDGPHGRRLRELAQAGRENVTREDEAELFRLDRVDDVRDHIAPALARGEVVLLDRYYFSTMAYQGALGLDVERIRRDNEAFAPVPDLVLYFDMDSAVSAERIEQGRGESLNLFERVDYLSQVRAIFRSFDVPYWQTIDAAQSPDAVHADVLAAVEPVLR